MELKQKKKNKVDNKFNFDDEYIIGVSNSASLKKNNKKKKTKKTSKTSVKNNVRSINKRKNIPSQKKRPKMNEKRSKLKVAILKIFLVLCLFIGTGCFLCLSPMFDVQEIIVEQNNMISADTIRSLSRIELYKNIFLINKSEAISSIESEPYVQSVKISRVLPNKIKIVVEERTEKYLVQFAEGKYAIIDGQGYILRATSELKDLPVLIGAQTNIEELINQNGNKNRLCNDDLEKLDIVANIVETCKNYEVIEYITKIDISESNNIKLLLEGEGKIAYLGSCTDLNTRILYLKDIINREKGRNGEIFINGNLSQTHVYFAESVE